MPPAVGLWIVFAATILSILALDLGVFHRRAHVVTTREAMQRSVLWAAVALAFGGLIWAWRGSAAAALYLTSYMIEESLSVDNIFVFIIIFTYFGVPRRYQHKVLFWGIVTAILLRGIFIGVGVAAIQRLHWLTYGLGALLVYTGVQLGRGTHHELEPRRNPVIRFCRRLLRVTEDFEGERFVVSRRGAYYVTPLFIVLVAIETTDIVFAVDSVPAVLGITTDPMIAYTSNIFAIIGLRSLYFALAGVLPRFRYLHHALAVVLVLVGVKMLAAAWYRPPTGLTLGGVALVLAAGVGASWLWSARSARAPKPPVARHHEHPAERT
jgi:TerC family integral membrane protein